MLHTRLSFDLEGIFRLLVPVHYILYAKIYSTAKKGFRDAISIIEHSRANNSNFIGLPIIKYSFFERENIRVVIKPFSYCVCEHIFGLVLKYDKVHKFEQTQFITSSFATRVCFKFKI